MIKQACDTCGVRHQGEVVRAAYTEGVCAFCAQLKMVGDWDVDITNLKRTEHECRVCKKPMVSLCKTANFIKGCCSRQCEKEHSKKIGERIRLRNQRMEAEANRHITCFRGSVMCRKYADTWLGEDEYCECTGYEPTKVIPISAKCGINLSTSASYQFLSPRRRGPAE